MTVHNGSIWSQSSSEEDCFFEDFVDFELFEVVFLVIFGVFLIVFIPVAVSTCFLYFPSISLKCFTFGCATTLGSHLFSGNSHISSFFSTLFKCKYSFPIILPPVIKIRSKIINLGIQTVGKAINFVTHESYKLCLVA